MTRPCALISGYGQRSAHQRSVSRNSGNRKQRLAFTKSLDSFHYFLSRPAVNYPVTAMVAGCASFQKTIELCKFAEGTARRIV